MSTAQQHNANKHTKPNNHKIKEIIIFEEKKKRRKKSNVLIQIKNKKQKIL